MAGNYKDGDIFADAVVNLARGNPRSLRRAFQVIQKLEDEGEVSLAHLRLRALCRVLVTMRLHATLAAEIAAELGSSPLAERTDFALARDAFALTGDKSRSRLYAKRFEATPDSAEELSAATLVKASKRKRAQRA